MCVLPQVKLGHIVYVHDSSESTEDSFTLAASSYEIERRSLPVTVAITVKPVNDEPPTITRNTGLEVTVELARRRRLCRFHGETGPLKCLTVHCLPAKTLESLVWWIRQAGVFGKDMFYCRCILSCSYFCFKNIEPDHTSPHIQLNGRVQTRPSPMTTCQSLSWVTYLIISEAMYTNSSFSLCSITDLTVIKLCGT